MKGVPPALSEAGGCMSSIGDIKGSFTEIVFSLICSACKTPLVAYGKTSR